MKKKQMIIISLFSIIAIIIIATAIYFAIENNNEIEQQNQIEEEPVIEEGQQQYSQINLENTENAKVEDGKKINTSEALTKEKDFDGIVVKNIELVAEDGTTKLTAEVQNNTGKKMDAGKITINFINREGNVFAKLNSYLGDIENGKTGNLNASTTNDLANAYDFTIDF